MAAIRQVGFLTQPPQSGAKASTEAFHRNTEWALPKSQDFFRSRTGLGEIAGTTRPDYGLGF